MSAHDIKQGTFDFFSGILKTQYALPGILIWLAWQWIRLTPEEVVRMKELEPFLNSPLGIALAFVIVIAAFLIAISYVFSMLKSFKDDLKEIFSEPLKEMSQNLKEFDNKFEVAEKTLEYHVDRAEKQRTEIRDFLRKQQSFFEAR